MQLGERTPRLKVHVVSKRGQDMNDSAPPTLLDRLTRTDSARPGDQRQNARPAPEAEPAFLLDDMLDKNLGASGRSHGSGTRGAEPYMATDFAITTVNVPDRLDLREVRDQAEEDYKRPGLFSFDRYLLGLWVRRVVWFTALGLLGLFAFNTVQPIRQELAAERISQRLSAGAGFPVRVSDTAYRFSPTPKFVLVGVQIADDIKFDEVAIRFNWQDTWNAVRGGAWSWGEATVAPVRLSSDQAWSLLKTATGVSKAFPDSLSVLRFESIEVLDAPLLKRRLEAVLRRGGNGQFGPVAIAEAGGQSTFKLTVVPPAAGAGSRFGFQFEASEWVLPLGPSLKWGDVSAAGFLSPTLFEVESYSIAGTQGVIQGAAYAATDLYWVLTGWARGTGLSVESIIAAAGRARESSAGAAKAESVAVPFSGTATFNVALSGRGESLTDAVGKSAIRGPLQIRWAAINGINLGYVATHRGLDRGLGGGQTRFSEVEASIASGPDGFAIRDIVARAGAMSTRGEILVGQDLALTGMMRVDLGATRVQAPTALRVRGTLLAPQFGR